MNGKRNAALIFIILCLSYFQTLGQNYVPGEVLIKMKPEKTIAQKNNLKHQMNVNTLKTFSQSPLELWQINTSQTDVKVVIQQYKNHPDIEYIEPNYIYTTENVTPNDPFYVDEQWALPGIDANAAWEFATRSPSIKVGIVDTGIDWKHEDLAKNIWQNLGEDIDGDGKVIEWNGSTWVFDPDDEDGLDSDNNGYADDFVGWDFINNDNNPMDDHSHGTHIAGIIGAQGNNGLGVTGLTWDVQMVAIKAFDNGGNSSAIVLQEAIRYAAEMNIPITNNSWSGEDPSDPIYESMQMARDMGHLFIASAGNNGLNNDSDPRYPTSYELDNIISVASVDDIGQLAENSNYGPNSVNIAAPGVDIYSTLPGNQYGYMSGTSMAAPYVAGTCALLWGQYPYLTPNPSSQINEGYKEIKEAITSNVTPPEVEVSSQGILNVEACIDYFPSSPGGCRVSDSLALAAIYHATNGAAWANTWDLTTPITTWYGVTLNSDKCVTDINLRYNKLDGVIPPEISYLSHLEKLNLGNNELTGSIPAGLCDLTNLELLFLATNQLTGEIPSEIGNLTKLYFINIGVNQLSGTIPNDIYNLPDMVRLHLAYNDELKGTIPPEVENMTQLKVLNLRHTSISGEIPPEVGNLTKLIKLHLRDTNIEGCYPINLTNIRDQLLNTASDISANNGLTDWNDFRYNDINICDAFGPCRAEDSMVLFKIYDIATANGWTSNPPWDPQERLDEWYGVTLDERGCLIGLNLSGQGILSNNGDMLDRITSLSSLETLDISNNYIIEFIPTQIYKLSNLSYFNAFNNRLYRFLPTELGQLSNLTYLNLASNNLEGAIPPQLGDLNDLTSLYLNDNMLEGYIPAQLGNLNNLTLLRLNNNQLSNCYNVNLANLCPQLQQNSMISNDPSWSAFCGSPEQVSCGGTVWPGDMDSNGRVDKDDFLYWGVADGATGIARSDMSTDWNEKVCEDWDNSASGINNKHQDADGNGIVDAADIDVILQNYSQSHNFNLNNITYVDAQFFLDENYDEDPDNVTYTLSVQSDDIDFYGVASEVDINMEANVSGVEFESTSGNDFVSEVYYHTEQSTLDVALTNYSESNNLTIPSTLGTLGIVIQKGALDGEFSVDLGGSGMLLNDQSIENPVNSTFYRNVIGAADGVPRLYANVRHSNCTFPTGEIYLRVNEDYSAPAGTYDIQWSSTEIPANTFEITDVEPGVYTMTVRDLTTGRINTMTIEVRQQYISGYDESGNPIDCLPTSPNEGKTIDTVEDSYLQQNYPNPFSTNTTIPYNIPEDVKNPVLNIFDVTGNLKYTIPTNQTGKGEIQINQHQLQPGIYYYQLKMDDRTSKPRKMIIIK